MGIWGTVVTIIIAVISSGTVVAIINWLSSKPVNSAEAENIWDQIKSRRISEADSKLKETQKELKLSEYKVDHLIEGWSDTIEKADKLPGGDFADSRRKLIEIKYLSAIPGSSSSSKLED